MIAVAPAPHHEGMTSAYPVSSRTDFTKTDFNALPFHHSVVKKQLADRRAS